MGKYSSAKKHKICEGTLLIHKMDISVGLERERECVCVDIRAN